LPLLFDEGFAARLLQPEEPQVASVVELLPVLVKEDRRAWLNEVEGFFGILGKQSLSVTDLRSKQALPDDLNAYMRAWKENPTPFAWTKPAAAIIRSHRRMLEQLDGGALVPLKPSWLRPGFCRGRNDPAEKNGRPPRMVIVSASPWLRCRRDARASRRAA